MNGRANEGKPENKASVLNASTLYNAVDELNGKYWCDKNSFTGIVSTGTITSLCRKKGIESVPLNNVLITNQGVTLV